ncbi:hypothetical protein MG293_010254 [Ovis ammon polii]|uniref:Uncharacterized protein n=1 Tax=Ovis ammon polii TaxID=230172 RepID=A0AAD4Y9N1_OVIAM|nr:hypothetical protein MG293_010254 [Ovis ammon polii]
MGQEEPLPPACGEHPGVTVEMILGWCRDLIQGLDTSSVSDMNEPKMRVCTIKVRPAVSSDLSSQEHTPPASPEESILIPAWLWETTEQQENWESREKTREPATPPPCPEARTITPSPGPSTRNTHVESSTPAANHAGDRHATCGTRLTCGTCSRLESSNTRDTSLTHAARDTCHTISTCDSCGTRGTSLTHDTCSTRDTSLTCDPSLPRDACSTGDTVLTSEHSLTCYIPRTRDTGLTCDRSLTCDAPNTWDPTGACNVDDTVAPAIFGTPGSPVTAASLVRPEVTSPPMILMPPSPMAPGAAMTLKAPVTPEAPATAVIPVVPASPVMP